MAIVFENRADRDNVAAMWTSIYVLSFCLVCCPTAVTSNSHCSADLPADCLEPTGSDCSWFELCLNARVPCGLVSPYYALDGLRLCDVYSHPSVVLSGAGSEVIEAARKCVQTSLLPLLDYT